MSNLVEALEECRDLEFDLERVVLLLAKIREGQDARGLALDRAQLAIEFTYFLRKAAPKSGLTSLVPYECRYDVTLNGPGLKGIAVRVPVTTVCPCSLAISELGAHNQRATVTVETFSDIGQDREVYFEDLISLSEKSASAGVHALLKRSDEKAVTEQMFRTPRFVEDIVREVVVGLSGYKGLHYRVRCESFESIHPYNAFAETSGAW